MGGFMSKKLPVEDSDTDSPKPKRIKLSRENCHAADIAYESLLLKGRDSDIDVVILNKTWKLHKSFLMQSPYFAKLLNKNLYIKKLTCSISDNNIVQSSLELCFSFMYGKCLDFITDANVDSIIATAIFLQLGDIIDQVTDYLIKNSNIENGAKYFYLAEKYNLPEVSEYIYQRFLLSFVIHVNQLKQEPNLPISNLHAFLSGFKIDLLERLLKDPDLVIVSDEMELYDLMKKWVMATNFYERILRRSVFATENEETFLESMKGKKYKNLFEILNLPNIFFLNAKSYDLMKRNKIIPLSYLEKALEKSWKIHITYFDFMKENTEVNRFIPPAHYEQIIKDENDFLEKPNRIFKRFSYCIATRQYTQILNGFTFSIKVKPDDSLMLSVKAKPDVPHILIPTVLYLKYKIYHCNIWEHKPLKSNVPHHSSLHNLKTSFSVLTSPSNSSSNIFQRIYSRLINENNSNSIDANDDVTENNPDEMNNTKKNKNAIDCNNSKTGIVLSQSDLFYMIPFPSSGINKLLYKLPAGYYQRLSDASNNNPIQCEPSLVQREDINFNLFMSLKFIPHEEINQLKNIET